MYGLMNFFVVGRLEVTPFGLHDINIQLLTNMLSFGSYLYMEEQSVSRCQMQVPSQSLKSVYSSSSTASDSSQTGMDGWFLLHNQSTCSVSASQLESIALPASHPSVTRARQLLTIWRRPNNNRT